MSDTIRLIKIIATPINLIAISDRRYKLAERTQIDYHTNEGVIRAIGEKDFETDGRSGGFFVDMLMPNIGTSNYRNAWCGHDIMFALSDKRGVSFEIANSLFQQALSLSKKKGGMAFSSIRVWIAWKGVSSLFGLSAFEKSDASDKRNQNKCHLEWSALA